KGLKEVYSFYPRDNKEGIFIFGFSEDFNEGMFYYDLKTKKLTDIFQDYDFPEGHRKLIDFSYGINR
ncbi:MAG: hypothetical protein AB2375_07505, partial [Tissierellaceae bacterium]